MKDELYNRSMIMSGVCDMDMDILLNILDNLQNAVLIINTEGTIVYINREYTARLGIPPEKLLGRKLSKMSRRLSPCRCSKQGSPYATSWTMWSPLK